MRFCSAIISNTDICTICSAVARYVTPSGTEIQGIGITPDISGNMPAPVVIPVLSTDTSKVDFNDISKRLDPSICKVPAEHATKQSVSAL